MNWFYIMTINQSFTMQKQTYKECVICYYAFNFTDIYYLSWRNKKPNDPRRKTVVNLWDWQYPE